MRQWIPQRQLRSGELFLCTVKDLRLLNFGILSYFYKMFYFLLLYVFIISFSPTSFLTCQWVSSFVGLVSWFEFCLKKRLLSPEPSIEGLCVWAQWKLFSSSSTASVIMCHTLYPALGCVSYFILTTTLSAGDKYPHYVDTEVKQGEGSCQGSSS